MHVTPKHIAIAFTKGGAAKSKGEVQRPTNGLWNANIAIVGP
jgi:hypothetical protein